MSFFFSFSSKIVDYGVSIKGKCGFNVGSTFFLDWYYLETTTLWPCFITSENLTGNDASTVWAQMKPPIYCLRISNDD